MSVDKLLPDREHLSLSSASQVASNIDVLIEILKRLPVKPLLGFKSVSKQWLSLISDPHFVHKHFIQNPHLSVAGLYAFKPSSCFDGQFFFLDGRDVPSGSGAINPFKSLNFLNSSKTDTILQSCNGLILCRSRISDPCLNSNSSIDLNYYIYNPCTRQCKSVSSLPRFPFNLDTFISVSLAFDPLKSPHYKLVWIWKDRISLSFMGCIHIYSSETNTWRRSEYQFDKSINVREQSGTFWNGSLNWVTNCDDAKYSICFDIDQDLLKRVPLPQIPNRAHGGDINIHLSKCTEHLYCIKSYDKWLSSLDILEMSTDFSVWNVKYSLNLKKLKVAVLNHGGLTNYFYCYSATAHPFRIMLVQEEEDHLKLVVNIPSGQVVSYNTKEKKLKEIHNFGQKKLSGNTVIVCQFFESLAQV